jgi:hypothetical protein
MNRNLKKLAERRQLLIAQIASQRMSLTHNAHSWLKPLSIADKGLVVLRYIKNHPLLIAGDGVALLTMARPSGIGKWFRRGWLAWQVIKKLKS